MSQASVFIKGISGSSALLKPNRRANIEIGIIIKDLSLPKQEISREVRDFCLKKTGVQIEKYVERPSLLIGQDNAKLLAHMKVAKL